MRFHQQFATIVTKTTGRLDREEVRFFGPDAADRAEKAKKLLFDQNSYVRRFNLEEPPATDGLVGVADAEEEVKWTPGRHWL